MESREVNSMTRRRKVLTALCSSVALSGCLSSSDDETTDTATVVTSISPTPTVSPTENTRTTVETETESPTREPTETRTATAEPTETPETPTPTPELNKTRYAVGLPYQTFGMSSTDAPLLGKHDTHAGVYPIRSKQEWKEVRTDGDQNAAETFEGYEFIAETDFSSETIVIVQKSYITGVVMQLESVSGVGTEHISMEARRVGETPLNTRHFRYLFVRLPTDGEEIERITVEIEQFGETVTLEYDGSGTPTPPG